MNLQKQSKNSLFFCVLLIFFQYNSIAQKVGLVLSGGGASGIAHIGVLKALEENHIPIDYITGTSMGACVGSMYAMGFTPKQIEDMKARPQLYISAPKLLKVLKLIIDKVRPDPKSKEYLQLCSIFNKGKQAIDRAECKA